MRAQGRGLQAERGGEDKGPKLSQNQAPSQTLSQASPWGGNGADKSKYIV